MPRRKHSYTPKVKGCYECSQRRIDCDRGQPSCAKCTYKGLTCSGIGFRYRFSSDIRTRGIVRRKKNVSSGHDNMDRSRCLNDSNCGDSMHLQPYLLEQDQESANGTMETANYLLNSDGNESATADLDYSSLSPTEYSKADSSEMSPAQCLAYIKPWKDFLLTYFSETIAPEMVVIDDCYNGWRYLILPIALVDELVMDAVLTVSAFHLSVGGAEQTLADPRKLYTRVIQGLQWRDDLISYSLERKQHVVMVIMLLLVALMVNGSSDFPIVFGMLQSALKAMGGECGLGKGEVAEFVLRQIYKMRVYAAPLLGEDEGLHDILLQSQQSFDCLHYYRELHPYHATIFGLIADLRQQAYNIYLQRVLGGPLGVAATEQIERFKRSLQSFPDQSPGEHVLVWATFIAASESSTSEHRLFFKAFLEKQYRRNGFLNIRKALGLLERIWTSNICENWPSLLPEPKVFIM